MTLHEMSKNYNFPFHDAIYIEQFSILLPTYTNTELLNNEIILGKWLSGGVNVPASSLNKLSRLINWMSTQEIKFIVKSAGFLLESDSEVDSKQGKIFTLPGRPSLAAFFNEHIIEIIRNQEKYKRAGINFPSAIILYGPPGCGKTFAVEKLVKFLDWPCYRIEVSSVASPYIHETSRKISEIFDEVSQNAPSVIIIDEMDAFLSDRNINNSGLHHVEEISEFLRRIPEAPDKKILIIAMTNRLDSIDPAVLRHKNFIDSECIEAAYKSLSPSENNSRKIGF